MHILTHHNKFVLGSSLIQNGSPLYFASRSLNKTEIEYAQIEKELLAITFSCKNFTIIFMVMGI